MQGDSGFDLDAVLKKHQAKTFGYGFSAADTNTRTPYKSLLDELSADLAAFDAPRPVPPIPRTSNSLPSDVLPSDVLPSAHPDVIPSNEHLTTPNTFQAPAELEETPELYTPEATPSLPYSELPPESPFTETHTLTPEEVQEQNASQAVQTPAEVLLPNASQIKPRAKVEWVPAPKAQETSSSAKLVQKWRRISIALIVVVALLSLVSVALATDWWFNQGDKEAENNTQTSATRGDPEISKASPFYFAGGQGCAIILRNKIEISSLKFKSSLDSGIFELRATSIAQPLGGTVLFEGPFESDNEISFDTISTGALVLVYKNLPEDVKSVHLTDISVE